MEFLGAIPLALGTLLIALGGLYVLLDQMYGGAVFYWSLMWGLMAAGFGLALMGTQRRWVAVAGILTCLVSVGLTAYWHQFASLNDSWLWLIGTGCSAGILYASVAVVWQSVALRRARQGKE
jgi:hypothetical protein